MHSPIKRQADHGHERSEDKVLKFKPGTHVLKAGSMGRRPATGPSDGPMARSTRLFSKVRVSFQEI